jgi:hypothetical protein
MKSVSDSDTQIESLIDGIQKISSEHNFQMDLYRKTTLETLASDRVEFLL